MESNYELSYSLDDVETFLRIWGCTRHHVSKFDRPGVCENMLEYFNLSESTLIYEAIQRGWEEIPVALKNLG